MLVLASLAQTHYLGADVMVTAPAAWWTLIEPTVTTLAEQQVALAHEHLAAAELQRHFADLPPTSGPPLTLLQANLARLAAVR